MTQLEHQPLRLQVTPVGRARHATWSVARLQRIAGRLATFALLLVVGLLMVLPFLAMLSQSLKGTGEFLQYPFEWLPAHATLANYRLLFSNSQVLRWTLNSFLIAGGVSVLQVLTCSLAAYAFARKRFTGRDPLFWVLMTQVILPYQVTIIPVFLLLSGLHLTDTYFAFWLPFGTNVFGTFLLRQSFITIPHDYDEAARIDGANDFQIYWHVLLPMVRPALVVLVIFTFIFQWNDFLYPLIATQSDSMKTLQVGLAQLQPIGGQPGVLMAGATFAFVPTLVLFVLLQRHIVTGLQSGGLKG
jgi:multiple sugar transport system permease protein